MEYLMGMGSDNQAQISIIIPYQPIPLFGKKKKAAPLTTVFHEFRGSTALLLLLLGAEYICQGRGSRTNALHAACLQHTHTQALH